MFKLIILLTLEKHKQRDELNKEKLKFSWEYKLFNRTHEDL